MRQLLAARTGTRRTLYQRAAGRGGPVGDDVVQLYTRRLTGSVWPRARELKAFQRITVPADEPVEVGFELGFEELAVWLTERRFDVEPGRQQLIIGDLTATLTIVG